MNTIVRIIFLFATSLLTAQDFQGIATYRTSQEIDIKMDSTKVNDVMEKELREQLSKEFDKEQTLKFNKKESLYEEVEELKLENPQDSKNRITILGHSGQQPLYRNTATGKFVRQEELMGKRFLVVDSLEKPDWKMGSEQKKIGNYTCFKATWTRTVDRMKWNREDGFEDTKVEVVTTAWYTPEIPVSHGPNKYWGLPGLILEVQEEKMVYLCTGITLNPGEKFEIEVPSKGKVIDSESFEKLRKEKNKEMLEQFSKGRDGGMIKIKG